MCIQYAKGRCQDGSHCRFAHSIDELRQNMDENKTVVDEKVGIHKNFMFDEDRPSGINKPKPVPVHHKTAINSNSLRKVVHSSDYEDEAEAGPTVPEYDPTNHRYNYLNPFFFYSFNNFPVYYPMNMNQTMPFFNYISINNNSNNQPQVNFQYKNSDESSQFNSKSSEEGKVADKKSPTEDKSYKTIEDEKLNREGARDSI